ncbi:hypothetical protein BDY21DRAFT_369462 [Lineolata rhizophorae]|uniref:SH3 domain-containing protein n=1 Tax=Lineolata rhizophorae TaxID=578093 RepID=A0A6A6P8X8_9PEZI|nr:hypothetical protein BDY21DRAFT_369462 [Lineolata rhizophorae]
MPWRPLPRIAFAVCTYPFQPSSPADLPLEIGDELYIIEQGGVDGAWYRGYLVAPPSLLAGLTSVKGQTLEARVFSGIFPRCCVEVRELLGETPAARAATSDGDRQDQELQKPGSAAGRRVRSRDGEGHTNGLTTPSDSLSASSVVGRLGGGGAERPRTAKGDATSHHVDSFTSGGRPSTSRAERLESKRVNGRDSRFTMRSDNSQQLALPMSPISVGPRDPNCPKPPAPVPMLKIGDETPTSAQEPLVDEIASCLREWHSTKLHELLLSRRYSTLDKMSNLVQRLDSARRQLLHRVLTAMELERLREATVWDLVNGNKMLSGEVIVRSPSQRGRILTSEDSPIEITRLQSMMSLLDGRPTHHHIDEHVLHHLLVELKSLTAEISSPATIAIHLCSKFPGSTAQPISEVYAIDLTAKDATTGTLLENRMKTLFTDLSAADMGEGAGAGSTLYLVLKLLTNEPFRTAAAPQPPPSRENSSHGQPGVYPSQFGSLKGGRRSVMWGGKSRKDSELSVNHKHGDPRPSTGGSVNGRPSESEGRTPSRDQRVVKRTVGLGVLRMNPSARPDHEGEQEVILWTPSLAADEDMELDSGWDDVISELMPSVRGKYKKAHLDCPLLVHTKAFENPDAESLIKKTPTLLHNIGQTHKIGFSGAPTKSRSDIYVTLDEPFLPRNAFLSHPKNGSIPLAPQSGLANLQLTLEVRRSTGERIENCIYPSCNSAGHTAWRTTAIERGEAWNMTIRLAIAPEDVPGSHIVMSIADAPGFPFALCWMPLWTQEAFIRDGDHFLSLYKYDEYTSSMISGRGAYLALPWSSKRKDEAVTGPMASLKLRTYLCSTKYSQDPNLLGLLKWRDQDSGELVNLLKRFPFVPEIEIVKLLNEVFDALFEILVEFAGSDEYEDLVFNALVIVLGIVHDRRFNLGPLVDQYAETRFNYPFATACLLRSLNRLLTNPTDPETSRRLRATFKVGAHVLKFIINARQKQREKEVGIGITNTKTQSTFTKDLRGIFTSLENLMINPAPILIGTKTLVVQHFHSWLPELSSLMTPDEILQIASSFIDACAGTQGKLVLYKLVLIIHLGQLDVFKDPDTRRSLLANTSHWLAPHWGRTEAVTDQWKDQVRLCCSAVASHVSELGPEACEYIPKLVDSYRAIQMTPREPKKSLSLLFPTSYPFPSRSATTEAAFDEALVEISAVLAATSNSPTMLHLDMPKSELADFMFNALQVYISILDGDAFPTNWLSVHIAHHRSTMRTLEKLSSILIDSFLPHPDDADQFNTELWRAFFDALLKLVGSDALALETFPEQKRRAVWKIAGDVRELGAELLQRSWEAIGWETSPEDRRQYGLEKMGGYQVQYVPGLVGPIVELCLSVHEGLRKVAIEVLQTMIISDWTLTQDLALIQAEMIDCLDRLFKSKTLTESILQKLFIGELMDLFEPLSRTPEVSLYSAVKDLITTIDEMLDLLVAVHSTEATGEEAFHIMDTLRLMEFLKDMQKEDIYIRYVHQLAQLQADARNFTEAGLALRLHSELYEWDPTAQVEPLEDPSFSAQTEFERKEFLYFEMIKFYEEGQSWDNALQAYSELATQYEHNVFDFAKLARTQRAMATIYEAIGKGERQNPRYFRVVYKGLGFPASLRDKQFIFEGSPSDRLATFTDKMQQQYPSAQILSTSAEEELEGQYLQIYPVSPQKNLLHPIYQRPKVAQPIREYYILSRPSHFTTPSRRQASAVGDKDQTVEKTVYTTAEPFPTILRRSEIVGTGTVTLSPIQIGIERTTRKTSELAAFEKRIVEGDDNAFGLLADALTISVDPSSEYSVARYRMLIPQPPERTIEDEYFEEEEDKIVLDPLQNALKVALFDHALAVKRCLGLFSRPAQQATKADLMQRFEIAFAPELASMAPPPLGHLSKSPSTSWFVNSPTPPKAPSPVPAPSHIRETSVGQSNSDGRPVRHEKNRMSLTFLKRGSFMERESRKESRPSVDHDDGNSSRSRSKDAGRKRLSFLPSNAEGMISRQSSVTRSHSTDERPDTGKTDLSSSQTVDRVGSVKKRLSLLNIGKKSSKNSVKGRMGESVAEE